MHNRVRGICRADGDRTMTNGKDLARAAQMEAVNTSTHLTRNRIDNRMYVLLALGIINQAANAGCCFNVLRQMGLST